LKKCKKCGRYALELEKCPECGGELTDPSPPRFSLEDPYLKVKLRAILEKRVKDDSGAKLTA